MSKASDCKACLAEAKVTRETMDRLEELLQKGIPAVSITKLIAEMENMQGKMAAKLVDQEQRIRRLEKREGVSWLRLQ